MRILVTGTDGYLGSLLAAHLLARGYDVVGVDAGYYKEGWLYHSSEQSPRTLGKDIRDIDEGDLEGVDVVVHLAELSNDPAGELAPTITYEINHEGSVRLASLAKARGVSRFVYTSSCSVYGVADDVVDENSPLDPQTAYAKCKAMVERDVGELADDNFSPTFLRNATAFGASPRMRFDIVLNNLAGLAWTAGEIAMTSDGTPWRPLVHALDIARAIELVCVAPRERVHRQVLNVGSNEQNYRVRDIAEIVGDVFAGCTVSFGDPSADNRSYRVAFDKIVDVLPDFTCAWDARRGAAQLYDVFNRIDMSRETFEFRAFTRVRQLQHLLRTGQLDEHFFWSSR
jgi:nucleoside-diphosphate-sugar epimerase